MSGIEWLLTFKYFTEQKKKEKERRGGEELEYEFFILSRSSIDFFPPPVSRSSARPNETKVIRKIQEEHFH